MTDSKTFVLTCEDGYKITVVVAMNGNKVALTSNPPQIDSKHDDEYNAWLEASVVPVLLEWFPHEVKLAFAMLGAKIIGKSLDKDAQDSQDD